MPLEDPFATVENGIAIPAVADWKNQMIGRLTASATSALGTRSNPAISCPLCGADGQRAKKSSDPAERLSRGLLPDDVSGQGPDGSPGRRGGR